MEATISNALVLESPLLLAAVVLLARGWSRTWVVIVAVYIGLMVYFSQAHWGGPGDAAVGRGMTMFFALCAIGLTGVVSFFVIMGRLAKRNRDEAGNPSENI